MSAPGSSVPALARLTALPSEALLRGALKLDAVVTAANGAAYVVAADALDGALGLPAALLRPVGVFLLAFAALVWLVATRPALSLAGARGVVAVNALWVIDSAALVAFGWFSPALAGEIVVTVQAVGVAALAALQAYGLRGVQAR